MALLTAALAVLHVLFGMNFLGAVFILNLVLGPIVLVLPPSTVRGFFTKFWPPMARFLHVTIGGTALFGFILYFNGDFGSMSGTSSIYLDAGIALAVLAIIEAEAVQIPTVNRLVEQMSAGDASSAQEGFTPDQLKILNRVKVGGIIGVVTMTLTTVFMVAAAWA
jgi:hypothetical protein